MGRQDREASSAGWASCWQLTVPQSIGPDFVLLPQWSAFAAIIGAELAGMRSVLTQEQASAVPRNILAKNDFLTKFGSALVAGSMSVGSDATLAGGETTRCASTLWKTFTSPTGPSVTTASLLLVRCCITPKSSLTTVQLQLPRWSESYLQKTTRGTLGMWQPITASIASSGWEEPAAMYRLLL